MVGKYLVLVLLPLLLFSCAQVGTISGGEKDTTAPQPIESKVNPQNETTRFTGKEVVIPFNEFIKLNNPAQNIRIVPPHATINASVKGKTLLLQWDEELQPSTTYSIYLNGAVKDITEGNDTIIQYVFSTGDHIDTLSYSTYVYSAKEIIPEANVTLGLYKQDSMEIVNFARTDDSGLATLRYLKPGNYRLVAFNDINNNLLVDPNEQVAFKGDTKLEITQSETDTIPMMLFQPSSEPRIRTFSYNPPGAFLVGCTAKIKNESLYLNNQPISPDNYRFYSDDSLVVYSNSIESQTYELVLKCDAVTDTISTRVSSSRIKKTVLLRSINKTIAPSEDLMFALNDRILSVDTSHIHIRNAADSSEINIDGLQVSTDEFSVKIDKSDLSEIIVEFDTAAIICQQGSSPYHLARLTINNERKYGALHLDLSAYTGSVILELYHDGKLEKTIPAENPSSVLSLKELNPGNYTFRVIRDDNSNGKWDTGNLDLLRQPEKIDIYSDGVNVRANWEVEVPLIPTNE